MPKHSSLTTQWPFVDHDANIQAPIAELCSCALQIPHTADSCGTPCCDVLQQLPVQAVQDGGQRVQSTIAGQLELDLPQHVGMGVGPRRRQAVKGEDGL